MKATLGDARNQIDTSVLGIQACSPAFVQLLNEATQRLLMGPERWWDVNHKMVITASNGCITWPRQIAAIESIAVCRTPITIRNEWFEFLESGYGIRCEKPCENQMFDRGTAVTFRAIRNGYQIKLYSAVTEDDTKTVGFLGYDCNGKWVRTETSPGVFIDGEWLNIPLNNANPVTGTVQWAVDGITAVIKPELNGLLNVYDYLASSGDSRKIATYEWDETRPVYRKSLVGSIPDNQDTQITVMYKQEYKPVANDNDFLLIANIPALSEMMAAVKLYRQNAMQLAVGHEGKALQLLDREVSHYVGQGTVEPVRIDYHNFGVGGLPTLY